MPAGSEADASSSSAAAAAGKRATFRPPWVKEGPNPLPVPAAPWALKAAGKRDSLKEDRAEGNPLAAVQLRKTSVANKEPQENGGAKESTFKLPQLKKVPPKEEVAPKKENKLPETVKLRKPPPVQRAPTLPQRDDEIDRAVPATRHALVREDSMRRLSQAAPAAPPMPPPPPKMPGLPDRQQLTFKQLEKLEQLKNRPKNRPDWTAMLKEIEHSRKLKHVECNDRSQPLLPDTKATEHFLYESEQPNVHNVLLKQIETGVKLKRVKTNDRSKPMLEGLRKFRRQMTIEEQIQKSVSMASIPPEEIAPDEADEMDDIDKVRDDLQSTKQMLALELRNKEAQIRENKRLAARIQHLEAELERGRGGAAAAAAAPDDKLVSSLKQEAEQARRTSEEAERKYGEMANQLDATKTQMDEVKRQNQLLEKKLQEALSGKRHSISKGGVDAANGPESDDDLQLSSADESDGDEDTDEKRERRLLREVKYLRNKLRNMKNKEDNAKKERKALKEIMKNHQGAMKEEKKKYKVLQKEVDKMASLMKDTDDDEDGEGRAAAEDDDEDEVVAEEEQEESSEESESETDDESESEQSQSEAEDAPCDKRKDNLTTRTIRHENRLAALKKGNFILKTNAERLQDDLNKQKELTAALQEDLDSVLAELG